MTFDVDFKSDEFKVNGETNYSVAAGSLGAMLVGLAEKVKTPGHDPDEYIDRLIEEGILIRKNKS